MPGGLQALTPAMHEPDTQRTFLMSGALLAGLAVAAGAFGAHLLERSLTPDRLATYETAVRYQMYHALGLLAVGWAVARRASRLVTWSGYLLLAGTLLFCGSLYVLVLADLPILGAVAPVGGVALIAGWLLLAVSFWNRS